jgi:hypothetical protein
MKLTNSEQSCHIRREKKFVTRCTIKGRGACPEKGAGLPRTSPRLDVSQVGLLPREVQQGDSSMRRECYKGAVAGGDRKWMLLGMWSYSQEFVLARGVSDGKGALKKTNDAMRY